MAIRLSEIMLIIINIISIIIVMSMSMAGCDKTEPRHLDSLELT